MKSLRNVRCHHLFLVAATDAVDRLAGNLALRDVAGQLAKLPLWKRDTSLFIDRGHEGREHLVHIADRLHAAHPALGVLATGLGTSVPDGHFGVEAADGVSVGFGQVSIDALLDHHVLHQAGWTTERLGEVGVGGGHGAETGCFLLLRDQLSLGSLRSGEQLSLGSLRGGDEQTLGFPLLSDELGVGFLGGGEEGGFSLDTGLIGCSVSGLLLAEQSCIMVSQISCLGQRVYIPASAAFCSRKKAL